MTRDGDDAERSDAEERRIMTDDGKGTDVPGQQGEPGQPSEAELNAMSGEELVALIRLKPGESVTVSGIEGLTLRVVVRAR